MRIFAGCTCAALLTSLVWTQQPATGVHGKSGKTPTTQQQLEFNVKAEWEAFKNKNEQAYSNLLADDFTAVEDDAEGMRSKRIAVGEVNKSVISNYQLFGLTVTPLDTNAALVIYEITFQFPPTAVVRYKRVLVSEVWIKSNGQWKERYYQETRVK